MPNSSPSEACIIINKQISGITLITDDVKKEIVLGNLLTFKKQEQEIIINFVNFFNV